ncbi:hypothetical protein [Propionivibrio sp.]|uniref:hypothetical protein n=1 Tax=Propionivibrio sp. TaxID=2212460 RepID=UPI00272DE7C6|nr:hypothetical protein [Propionivibrio sp.]
MRISWFFGFGWTSIVTVVACGIGINLLSGPVVWALYVPFLLVALYMTVRFRLYSTQPWRRIHSRVMIAFGDLAEAEYDAAKKESREYDIRVPCAGLAQHLFGEDGAAISALLLDENRKTYYKELATEFPEIFLTGVTEERKEIVLGGVYQDIETSKLGPDILIARAIEQKHSRAEAANYLHALMLGKVR